ncbi:MAG: IS21 family transposase [Paracoccaceae bacterium]
MLTPAGRLVRLILQDRLNNTQIATQTGLARRTVADWRGRITDQGFDDDDFEGLNDTEIRKLVTPGRFNSKSIFAQPDFEAVRFEKQERDVTLQLLHQEYLEKAPSDQRTMSMTTFYREYAAYLKASNPELHFTYEPGEMVQFDFVGQKQRKWPTLHDDHGIVRSFEVAVGVSALGQKCFVKAVESQAQAPFFDFVADMFEFYGGVPVLLTLDNFKAAVKEPRRENDPAVPTAGMQELADHYEFGVVAARIRKPRDKGLVEAAVGNTQNQILAPLRNRSFYSLAELNAAMRPLMDIVNERPMKTHRDESRNERFARLDVQGYQPLPKQRYEHGDWILKLRVGQDYHVPVDKNRYSIPSRLAGKKVDVKTTLHSVHIFHEGTAIATHQRVNTIGQRITNPDHMPPSHRSASLTRLSGAKALVRDVGPNAVVFIERNFRRNKKPNDTAAAAIRLVTLTNVFSADRVDAACGKAVLLGAANPNKVEEILSSGLDAFTPDEEAVTEEQTPSGNVRGPAYFAEILDFQRKDRRNG